MGIGILSIPTQIPSGRYYSELERFTTEEIGIQKINLLYGGIKHYE
jgi:hypothetical protein